MSKVHLWLRDEVRVTERRTPLTPEGAQELIGQGFAVTVERSAKRIIPDAAYQAVGCQMAHAGDWLSAPADAVILGLKELPDAPDQLPHTHIYFAHAFKEQAGWQDLLGRFAGAGGALLDLEYLAAPNGRRVAAFGYWAGYMGAALALIHWHDQRAGRTSRLARGAKPFDDAAAMDAMINDITAGAEAPRALVLGALGRSGSGAVDILQRHGALVTKWDQAETNPIDTEALVDHDIMINCALVLGDTPPFLRAQSVTADASLSVVSDVSCDPFSDFNPLPFYDAPTSWDAPYLTIKGGNGGTFDLIAIDNLPSLLPKESSADFAAQLLPFLKTLDQRQSDPVWSAARASFELHCARLTQEK